MQNSCGVLLIIYDVVSDNYVIYGERGATEIDGDGYLLLLDFIIKTRRIKWKE